MKKDYLFISVIALLFFLNANGQTIKIPSDPDAWDTVGVVPVHQTYKGKECLFIKTGAIVAKDVDFRDGIIEADICFPQERSFPGFGIRTQDLKNFEYFYVRPHQSGNPDATQYIPVFNGDGGFQLYHGEGYNNAYNFKFNEWHHIKIDLHGLQAEFYIDDTLVVKVKELLTGWKGGKIAVVGGPLYIANIQYTPRQNPVPTPIPIPENGKDGLITKWQVSNVINKSLFENQYQLTSEIKKKLKWTTQRSESTGIIDLARFGTVTETSNTMVAKVVVKSSTEQIKEAFFGFSDDVTVYLNGKAIYYGSDKFLSRDYRFLGTVGFFDKLFLPLKKGTNELWFVTSETFGGWGVKAKFENVNGLSFE